MIPTKEANKAKDGTRKSKPKEPKEVKSEAITKEVKSEEITEDSSDGLQSNSIVIEVLPFRVRRMDTNNIVIERLKKRVTSDETYWDIEGYYSNVVSAVVKLFYKDINSQELKSVKEVALAAKSAEDRIKTAVRNIKM